MTGTNWLEIQNRLLASYEEVRQELERIPGVVEVGVGLRRRAGALVDEAVYVVSVRRKLPPEQVPRGELVPSESAAYRRTSRSKAETERLLALLPDVRDRLIGIPGVTKVAVGVRERGGELTDEFVFRVHVEQKLPADEVPADQMVPAEVAGVPTDVVVRRRPVPEIGFGDEDDWTSYSPKVGGSRLGAEVAGGTGTLGCFCERTSDGKVVFLSNWHVLIDPGGANGDGVGHPKWRKSCCCTTGKIGEVVDFDEDLDCAIGLLDSGSPTRRRSAGSSGRTAPPSSRAGSRVPPRPSPTTRCGRWAPAPG